jgi:hypothetical protein
MTAPPWAAPAEIDLTSVEIPADGAFLRIFGRRHKDPLGSRRPAAYRFGCPPGLPDALQYGVVYLAETLETAFLEAIVRERMNDMRFDLVRPQPAGQPEAVPPGLASCCGPRSTVQSDWGF